QAPEDVRTRLVSGTYFQVLGVTPVLGRAFTEAEDKTPRAAPYTVLSYAFWAKRFAQSPDVIGKVIKLGKTSLTVIGVAPEGFFGETVGEHPDLWIPLMMQPDNISGFDWLH